MCELARDLEHAFGCWLLAEILQWLIRRVSHYLQEVFQPPIQNLPSWHAKLFGYWLAVCYTRFTKRTWNPPKVGDFSNSKAFFSGEGSQNGQTEAYEIAFDVRKESNSTLQGINISHPKALLKMVFLFPRWDMLVLRRVRLARTCLKDMAHQYYWELIEVDIFQFHLHTESVSRILWWQK